MGPVSGKEGRVLIRDNSEVSIILLALEIALFWHKVAISCLYRTSNILKQELECVAEYQHFPCQERGDVGFTAALQLLDS